MSRAQVLGQDTRWHLGNRFGQGVVAALPMPRGSADHHAHSLRRSRLLGLFRSRHQIRTLFSSCCALTAFVFFSSVWLALFLSKQITRPVEALADAMDEIATEKYGQRVALTASGEMATCPQLQPYGADLEPAAVGRKLLRAVQQPTSPSRSAAAN